MSAIQLGDWVHVDQGYGTRVFDGTVEFILGDACEVETDCTLCGADSEKVESCTGCKGDGTELIAVAIKSCAKIEV